MPTRKKRLDTSCEIEGCGSESIATMNGIRVCDRCRIHFVSVGMGAVKFGGRWHGVRGVTYTTDQQDMCPGLPGLLDDVP